jgi:hypothetical protein
VQVVSLEAWSRISMRPSGTLPRHHALSLLVGAAQRRLNDYLERGQHLEALLDATFLYNEDFQNIRRACARTCGAVVVQQRPHGGSACASCAEICMLFLRSWIWDASI